MGKKRNKEELPVVDIIFTVAERQVLTGEPPELWKLYFVISVLRDFQTNIAGLKTRISDRTFKEALEVTEKQGRQKSIPTTSQIWRWLKQLEKLDLIERRENYVFFCKKASSPQSAKKRCYQSVTEVVPKHDGSVTKNSASKNSQYPYKNRDKEDTEKSEVLPNHDRGVTEVIPDLRIPLNKRSYIDLTDHDHLSSSLYCADLDKKNTVDHFDEFWTVYPKKIGKKYAEQIWKRKKLNSVSDKIIDDVRQKASQDTQWQDGFIPNASTYLNQERWNDEIIRNRPGNPQSTQSYQSVRNQNATFYEQGFKALDEHTARKRKD